MVMPGYMPGWDAWSGMLVTVRRAVHLPWRKAVELSEAN